MFGDIDDMIENIYYGEGALSEKKSKREIRLEKEAALKGEEEDNPEEEGINKENPEEEAETKEKNPGINTSTIVDSNKEPVFLQCVCGKYPFIVQVLGMPKTYSDGRKHPPKELAISGKSWMLYCPKCGIRTDANRNVGALRLIWNAHALYGKIHENKSREKYIHFSVNGNLVNGVEKISVSKRRLNFLEYCYFFDSEYHNKIKIMLKPGMRFESYKELCLYLNEQPISYKTQQIQQAHRRWWNRFFSYGRMGRKFIILEIYDEYKPYSSKNRDVPNLNRPYDAFFPRPLKPESPYFNFIGMGERRKDGRVIQQKTREDEAKKAAKKEMEAMKKKPLEEDEEIIEEIAEGEEFEGYEIFDDDWTGDEEID